MVKFTEVKLSYTSPAFPPDGVFLNRTYSIIKRGNNFFFTDGITEFEGDLEYIKMLFTPNGDIKWEDVDFKDKVEEVKKSLIYESKIKK